jgi:glycosyltransferase involved in cell wall biosynthesis
LLQALQTLAAEGLGEEAIEARFVGTMPEADRIAATVLRNVHAIGFMPHTEAVRLMQEADVLLAIMGSEWTKAVAGKLYEYAAAQKPILLLSGNGASRDLVIENQWGWVCDPLDVDAITRTLRECLRLYKAAELPGFAPTAASIVKYDRRQATQRLAAVLDLLIA